MDDPLWSASMVREMGRKRQVDRTRPQPRRPPSVHARQKPMNEEKSAAAGTADLADRVAKALSRPRMKLADYIPLAWRITEPGTALISNWHIDLISEYLEAVQMGQIKNIIFNIPPRFSKSTIITVDFPTWLWTEEPTARAIFASHKQDLCTKHNMDRRTIIMSPWYQENWGDTVTLAKDQNKKTTFQNTARGHFLTAPVGGGVTGQGGNYLIIDDLMDPKRAESKLIRATSLKHYSQHLIMRLDNENSPKIVVEQRLHKNDLTGYLLREEGLESSSNPDGWVHLKIPLECPKRTVYTYPISGKKKVYEEGELLCEARRGEKGIAKIKRILGDRGAAAQLQQKPSEEDGITFLRTSWKKMKIAPRAIIKAWIWDLAGKAKEKNDFCAGVLIYAWERGFFIKDVVEKRMRPSESRKAIKAKWHGESTEVILIEDKSSGETIIQDFQDDPETASLPIVATESKFNSLDKGQRGAMEQPQWDAGNIYIIDDEGQKGSVYQKVVDHFAEYPNGEHDDIYDAVIHGIHYLRKKMAPTDDDEDDYEEADDPTE